MISKMTHNMIEEIKLLDGECFNRKDNLRSTESVEALLSNNPEGCYVAVVENEIAAYVFSRVLGSVGFIGPLGVKPEYRGRDIGKLIVKKGSEALVSSGCTAIGLEVLPELGANMGLYLKSGYMPTFSTITFRKKSPYSTQENGNTVNGKNITIQRIAAFDGEFLTENNGYSLIKDIELAIAQRDSSIYFYAEGDSLLGFLCYSPTINPYVWGAFLRDGCQKNVFNSLFSRIEYDKQEIQLRIRINSRYIGGLALIDDTFDVERSIMRMVLRGYEGEFMSAASSAFVARSWVG